MPAHISQPLSTHALWPHAHSDQAFCVDYTTRPHYCKLHLNPIYAQTHPDIPLPATPRKKTKPLHLLLSCTPTSQKLKGKKNV